MKCRLCGKSTEYNFCSEACAKRNNELMSRGNYASPEDMKIRTFDEIVGEAAETGVAHVRSLAIAGISASVYLYYKKGALALASDAATFPMGSEWVNTGLRLPLSIPYDRYAAWIRHNAANLPLF